MIISLETFYLVYVLLPYLLILCILYWLQRSILIFHLIGAFLHSLRFLRFSKDVTLKKNQNIYFTLFYIMIKYSTIKELRFLQEDTYVMYYVGSSVGSFVVVVFLRDTLCSEFLLRLLSFSKMIDV